jgi:hypothetical protein
MACYKDPSQPTTGKILFGKEAQAIAYFENICRSVRKYVVLFIVEMRTKATFTIFQIK